MYEYFISIILFIIIVIIYLQIPMSDNSMSDNSMSEKDIRAARNIGHSTFDYIVKEGRPLRNVDPNMKS